MSKQISEIQAKLNKIKSLEKAPITGVVTEVFVTEGGYTMSGQSAFTIIDHQNLEIVAGVDEYSSKDIKIGQEVIITGDALADNTKLQGKVTAVAPVALQVQSASGVETLIEVTIEPTEGKDILKAGLTVDCDIITHEKNNIPIAEYNVFLDDKDRKQYVMLIDENMTIRQQYVELGVYSDMIVEIVDGLKQGDMVVVDPPPSLKDGDIVKVVD
jgi:multidrug efflux pump subunit AcrA (membrane-fusion protein)